MTEDELRAILAFHERKEERDFDEIRDKVIVNVYCAACDLDWPCETYRLAKLALAGMQVVTAAREEHGGNYSEPECPICSALAEYEEATK